MTKAEFQKQLEQYPLPWRIQPNAPGWGSTTVMFAANNEELLNDRFGPDRDQLEFIHGLVASQSLELAALKQNHIAVQGVIDDCNEKLAAKDKELSDLREQLEAVTKRKEDLSGALRFKVGELEKVQESNRELVEALTYARKRVFNLLRNVKWWATGCAATEQMQDDHANQSEAIKNIDAALTKANPQP